MPATATIRTAADATARAQACQAGASGASAPRTLSAQRSTPTRSARWRESARPRAFARRSATRGSTCVPWLRRWRMRLANCISFMAFLGRPSAGRSLRALQGDAPGPERRGQSMGGPGAMRFHAAFRASHDPRRFGDVHLLPVTHDESLALTRGQARQLLLNDFKHLSLLQARARRLFSIGPVGGLEGFQRVLILVLPAAGRERRKQRGPQRAHLLPAVPVPDGVLHDAMEQHRQLSGGAVAVLLGQPEHRVLHDVERRLLVAHGEHGLLERASLYAFEKRRKLASRCQVDPLRGYNSRAMLPSWFSRAFSPDRRPR